MVGRPCLGHPGGMSAEGIGCRERRVHRPFDGRSTPLAPAFAAIIIVDSGPARQTAPPDRASRTSHSVRRCSHRVRTSLGGPVPRMAEAAPSESSHHSDLRNVSAGQGT
ncbi:hypothetical protein G3I66_16085 [Streptomyces rubrogriseus]|uniref:Uncharacterized protein n=1 Tax=Streptomyces rubrogriseus TaxID=194673 RepID=A0A6G3TE01_9ACTN|nr:hypothetical protein [Streptomyces rubrogriseus]